MLCVGRLIYGGKMMTGRKWTPGPWVAMANGWIEASDGDPVAMINADGLPNSIFYDDLPNAHLIAAAPDLYEALDVMIKYCNAEPGTMAYPGTQAAAAIAKARGEQ